MYVCTCLLVCVSTSLLVGASMVGFKKGPHYMTLHGLHVPHFFACFERVSEVVVDFEGFQRQGLLNHRVFLIGFKSKLSYKSFFVFGNMEFAPPQLQVCFFSIETESAMPGFFFDVEHSKLKNAVTPN